jgi:hypothetical protein
MNRTLLPIIHLLLGLITLATINAQTPTKTQIAVAVDTPGLKITGNKTAKVENIEGGGIRISFNHTGEKRSSIGIEYIFPQPVAATNMGFEFRQAETERLAASGTFGEKQTFTKLMDRMGPELFPYTLDFAYQASEKKTNIEGQLKKVSISFRIAPQSGERFVELKNWWVE